MVTVGIVGLLSAVALPQFLGANTKAGLVAQISEGNGLSSECRAMISALGPYPADVTSSTGLAISQCNKDGGKPDADPTYTTTKGNDDTAGTVCGGGVTTTKEKPQCKFTVDLDNERVQITSV